MIEVIVVIFVGVLLIGLVRDSRKTHEKVKDLSQEDRNRLIASVAERPKRNFVVGGSVTNVPGWVFTVVILIFVVAMIYGAASTT